MFPGITVLTRDLNDIRAMHRIIARKRQEGKFDLGKFRKKETDDEIAVELVNLLRKGAPSDYKQVMGYWQRYGSIVRYFNVIQANEVPSIGRYRDIIFGEVRPKREEPFDHQDERKHVRGIRVENSEWYRRFRITTQRAEVSSAGVSGLLSNAKLNWWITGMDMPSSIGAPEIIGLSRRLEFALTVWQTALEAGTLLMFKNIKVPKAGSKNNQSIETFLHSLLTIREGAGNDEILIDLLQSCLDIHETYFRGGAFDDWISDFKKWLDSKFPLQTHRRYTTFHERKYDVVSLSKSGSATLLENLAGIHCYYCYVQKKPTSIYVHSFNNLKKGEKIPELSASYGGGRWGLFGYRLEASNDLYNSRKYES